MGEGVGGRCGECEQTLLMTIDQSAWLAAWLPGCLCVRCSSLFHHRQPPTEPPIAPTAPRGQSATPTPLTGTPFVPHIHLPAACASRAIYAPPNVCWTIGFPRFLQANQRGLVELQETTSEYVSSDSPSQSCSRWLPLVTTRSLSALVSHAFFVAPCLLLVSIPASFALFLDQIHCKELAIYPRHAPNDGVKRPQEPHPTDAASRCCRSVNEYRTE